MRAMIRRLRRCQSGVAFTEFALALPLFLGITVAGLEITHMVMATMKVQRLATMTADLVSQNGVSGNRLSEMQIYDILSAVDVSAQPLDLRTHGRIIVSAVGGVDTNNDGDADVNRLLWQRFEGGMTDTTPLLGCWSTSNVARLPSGRQLSTNETMFHAQVTYAYQPLFGAGIVEMFDVPQTITRTGGYRGRTSTYQPILSTDGYPAKDNCHA